MVRADRPPVVVRRSHLRRAAGRRGGGAAGAADGVDASAAVAGRCGDAGRGAAAAAALPPAAAPPPAAAAKPPAAAGGAKSALGAKYDSWNKFDEDEETLRLENEGKGDEPGWELRGGKGAASISCTEYKKDKEEVSLDRDLADSTKKLQVAFNRRLRDAAEFKTQGNEAMRVARGAEAYELYNDAADGVEMMHQSAAPLLSSRLSETVRQLRRDCHANAAQAARRLEEWDAAVHHATQALAAEPAHPKALFRRASRAAQPREGRRRRDAGARRPRAADRAAARQRGGEEAPRENGIRNFGFYAHSSQLTKSPQPRRSSYHDPSSVASSASSRCCSAWLGRATDLLPSASTKGCSRP